MPFSATRTNMKEETNDSNSFFVANSSQGDPTSVSQSTTSNDTSYNQYACNHSTQEDDSTTYKPLVIVIAGPTASGKSAIASRLSSSLWSSFILSNHRMQREESTTVKRPSWTTPLTTSMMDISAVGHIVSADSVQIYQGLQIGANKPTPLEMKETPHHLVSIVHGTKSANVGGSCEYNAADWRKDALYVLKQLTLRQRRFHPLDISYCHSNPTIQSDDPSRIQQQLRNEEEKDCLSSAWTGCNDSDSHDDTDVMITSSDVQRRQCINDYLITTTRDFDTGKNATKFILPIVTGGTMMYLQWLIHGIPDAEKPTQDAINHAATLVRYYQNMDQEREGLHVENKASGWESAVKYVSSLGAIFAIRTSTLSGRDWYRLRRTFEIAFTVLGGQSTSALIPSSGLSKESSVQTILDYYSSKSQLKWNSDPMIQMDDKLRDLYSGLRLGGLEAFGYDVRCFFICPDDRMAHTKVIDRRCEDMILAGLIEETATLWLDGYLPENGQQARSIGYRQTLNYLLRSEFKERDVDAFYQYLDDFTTATRRYAKKQMQWFRKDDKFIFVPIKLSKAPSERVDEAASIIRDMCTMPREKFEAEMAYSIRKEGNDKTNGKRRRKTDFDGEEDKNLTLSAITKKVNEQQGEAMKFYRPERYRLIQGSDDLDRIIDQADRCTLLIRRANKEMVPTEYNVI